MTNLIVRGKFFSGIFSVKAAIPFFILKKLMTSKKAIFDSLSIFSNFSPFIFLENYYLISGINGSIDKSGFGVFPCASAYTF